ncbi:conserved hypothetical protein [Trichodesmium erythraeum IMS101]|uniref:Uncharacterized protein n=1 Tax=Trichodesmium erythraeum (strain IMS101) TaxID=203124 RepID=Q10XG4_TRIEI|nr:hypothetical protein [Trichodesmium erythraeum GBRTRLIN201]MCH2048071.1 hypothetical protein [Trichodesmium sp. ALOHA_ZT_67]MCL2928780.1 hypothetical protein [Trichodesmium sp. MAG_R01]MDE5068894.1 hypothetical protein [Trichodesmium sp. St4_bin8_1]MDE5073337.1 hypothetical protein [Trichodesmium sp. St5_bin8]MDE5094481.1 hypothetical protein [Trichodesmium sp. St11_bin5]MDE5103004.1 hypothetical protein [Trichodesmium sp. St19_bin2]MDT9339098.1 hypothetical protein [Trichodesmium erythra
MYSNTFFNFPVYTVIQLTLLFAILLGVVFKDMLEYKLTLWSQGKNYKRKIDHQTPNIIATYLGTTLFVFLCVAASLSVFNIIEWLSILMGAIVVFPTALLIWVQLGSMFDLMANEGIEAINIEKEYMLGDRKVKAGETTNQ